MCGSIFGPNGLIPACTGKTLSRRTAQRASSAHPRMCGENQGLTWQQLPTAGSSPHVRGKPRDGTRVDHLGGLIPACTGKTSQRARRWSESRAHPRVCGENMACWPARVSVSGSSPRVRRKRHERHVHARVPRLIPACAGKTVWVCAAVFGIPAYPRVCGENHSNSNDVVFSFGSSPRVRGKPVRTDGQLTINGLIPACAGKTAVRTNVSRVLRAHPRVCGENTYSNVEQEWIAGSSPRVRGKRRQRVFDFP